MASKKSVKPGVFSTNAVCAALRAAFDGVIKAKDARVQALRAFCNDVCGNAPMSDEHYEATRKAIVATYAGAGATEGSAKSMASQDMRFVREYLADSDGKFRARADLATDVKEPFGGTSKQNTGSKEQGPAAKLAAAIRAAKLEKQYSVCLAWMTENVEVALAIIESHMKESATMASQISQAAERAAKGGKALAKARA